MLRKSKMILDVAIVGAESVTYVQVDEDTSEASVIFTMTYEKYEEFGEPDTITVTVQPGDLLNTGNDLTVWENEGGNGNHRA